MLGNYATSFSFLQFFEEKKKGTVDNYATSDTKVERQTN